jgi:hypothetical protein
MLIAIFIAKLFSITTGVLGIIIGLLSRAWWHVAVGSVVIAVLDEIILSALQTTRQFNPLVFLVTVAAAGIWSSGAFLIKTSRKKKGRP